MKRKDFLSMFSGFCVNVGTSKPSSFPNSCSNYCEYTQNTVLSGCVSIYITSNHIRLYNIPLNFKCQHFLYSSSSTVKII